MSKIIVIGGIESTYINAQLLHDLGEEIVLFFTRGKNAPGWEGVAMVDESHFDFLNAAPKVTVHGNINDHVDRMRAAEPDFIWSLGWQQMYGKALFGICPVIGIHESLLPEGAGAVPIANAILHDRPKTGVTLFELDNGMDTGPIIGQLAGLLDPRTATSTELYDEAMMLEKKLITTFLPFLREGTAPRIPQSTRHRTVYGKIDWNAWPKEKVNRALTYPYA